jgi:hypothetical protein
MSEDEAVERLTALLLSGDTECAHAEADDILCELLRSLGYGRVVDAWEKIDKGYA